MSILYNFLLEIFLFFLPIVYVLWSVINIIFKLYFPESGYNGILTINTSILNSLFSGWCFLVLLWIFYNEYSDSWDSEYHWYDCFWIIPFVICAVITFNKRVRNSYYTFLIFISVFIACFFIRSIY